MSLRLSLLRALMRVTAKPLLARVETPLEVRKHFELFTRLAIRTPKGITETETDAPPMLWLRGPGADPARLLLYFHGGGYIASSPHSHRAMVGRLALLTGATAVLPAYRLGPEHPLPAAQEDARAAWDAVIAQGYEPTQIALGGDSAGGGLALSLMAELSREGIQPAAFIGFSPWTDLSGSGMSVTENAERDPLLPAHRLPELVGFATGGTIDPADPRISPLFAEMSNPPPVLLQVSDTEILYEDSLRMSDKLRAAGGEVRVETWPDCPHVWQLFDGKIPEARAALTQAAAFLNALTGWAKP